MARFEPGERLMLAFEGYAPPPRILEWLRERPLAGVTLFRPLNVETPAQVRALTAALQAAARRAGRPPLLIAADQEGGQLNALGEQTTQFAGNMALAAAGDVDLAERVALAMGRELAALGVHVNYAPDCDLNTNPRNPAAGIRTFGDDPALGSALAAAMVRGFQSAGVAATVKHFPGKGEARVDSHYAMPVIEHDRARLAAVELRPFRAALAAGAKLAMSGHFAIPALTGQDDLPATLSRAVMHDLLRRELGFDGVVITDALDMGAITQGAGQLVDVIAAVRADVDLLLTTNQPDVQERLHAGLRLAASRGLIGEKHAAAARRRIRALQAWAGAMPQPALAVVGCAAHRALAAELAAKAITLVRDDAGLLPLRPAADARVLVVLPQPTDLTPADTSSYVRHTLAQALRQYHSRVEEVVVAHAPAEAEITAVRQRAAQADWLIVGTIDASMQPAQAALAQALLDLALPTVTVALRTPYDLAAYPRARTHLCSYGILPPAMDALAAVLWGEAAAVGRLPVRE